MRILFNMGCTVEIPNADKFPPREEVEKALKEELEAFLGVNISGLEITNYAVPADE